MFLQFKEFDINQTIQAVLSKKDENAENEYGYEEEQDQSPSNKNLRLRVFRLLQIYKKLYRDLERKAALYASGVEKIDKVLKNDED